LDAVRSGDLEGFFLELTLGGSVVRLGASHEDGFVDHTVLHAVVQFGAADLFAFGEANDGGKGESKELHAFIILLFTKGVIYFQQRDI
jgi:hypothetical protein